jgi:hypothetical protein
VLDFQLVQAPFRFGVDEGTDPKQVPFGTLLTAQNVVWQKSGRLQKRFGTESLGEVPDAKRLLVRGNELLITDGSKIYSYGGFFDGGFNFYDHGKLPNLGLTWETANDSTQGVKASDIAYLSNGQIVHAWVTGDPNDLTTGGDVYFQITDPALGALRSQPTRIAGPAAGATRVRIVSSGTTAVILWTGSGDLKAYPIVGSLLGPASTLQTDVNDNPGDEFRKQSFDAVATDASNFVVAYADISGGISLVRYNFSLVSQATGTVTGEASTAIDAISIDGAAGEALYILYSDFSNDLIRVALANASTLAQTVAPATVVTAGSLSLVAGGFGVRRTSSTTAIAAFSFTSSATAHTGGVLFVATITSGGVVATVGSTAFINLLSRPFTVNSRHYAVVGQFAFSSDINNENDISGADTFLIDITEEPPRLVGKIDLLIGGTWHGGHVTNVVAADGSSFICSVPFQGDATSTSAGGRTVVRQGIRTVTVTYGDSLPADMWRSVAIGQETYFAAGVLGAYDGDIATAYGFAHAAYLYWVIVSAATTGGSMSAGDYTYNTVPERRSAAGVLHRGPSAVAQIVEVGGTTASLVEVPIVPVHLSDTTQREIIALYRSTVDGEVVQRLTIEPTYAVVDNDASVAGLITYEDTDADDGIGPGSDLLLSERPPIYTEGGELDDYQPPAFLTVNLYRERIFGIAGDRQTVWFSKNHAENPGIAPGFHPQFRFVFNDRLTALATLDERQFVFSETGIYYFAGDGPAANGDSSDYGTPQKLQTDVGCTNPRGVVSTPMGIMFVAGTYPTTEIHLLDRGLNVQWIGKPVQDLLDSYPNVTSAVLVAQHNQVRFSCQADDGLTGIVLVFDYVEKQWAHFVYGDSLAIVDACLWQGAYTFVTTEGLLFSEDTSTYLDDGEWVTAKIETAWVHGAGPLAYHAVRNFQIDGESATAHGLSISVGFDGNSTYQQGPRVFAEGVSGVTSPGLQQARVSIGTRRKCGAIRFKIEDSEPATPGTGQGAKWSSMGIEVGVNTGTRRLPATQAR